jgi:hypothetical protein
VKQRERGEKKILIKQNGKTKRKQKKTGEGERNLLSCI